MSETEKKYHAFISYRHADNKEQGRQWATWLHQAIETYEVPADLVGQENGRGEIIPARIFPIFRDEEELPANADLGKSIVGALDSTRLLIVLCSPRAVASTYVAEEIDYFKKQGHSDQIIAAMIDGEPNTSWDKAKQASGFKIEDECFPVPLQFEYDEQGRRTDKHAEPIAADFRINNNGVPEQAWTSPEAYRQYLKTNTALSPKELQGKIDIYQQQQHLMLLKIIAGILGVALGELTQRDKEYQLEIERKKAKNLRSWLSGLVLLSFVAVIFGVLAFIQKEKAVTAESQAIEQTNRAQMNQSNFLIDLARQEDEKGNSVKAILLGLNAMPGVYGGVRNSPKNYESLSNAVMKNKVTLVLENKEKLKSVAINADNSRIITNLYMAFNRDEYGALWDAQTGEKISVFEHEEYISHMEFSHDGKLVITASKDKTVGIWDAETGILIHKFQHNDSILYANLSSDRKLLASALVNGEVVLWDVATRKQIFTIQEHYYPMWLSSISPDNKYLLTLSSKGTLSVRRTSTGKLINHIRHKDISLYPIYNFDSNRIVFALSNKIYSWDFITHDMREQVVGEEKFGKVVFSHNRKLALTTYGGSDVTLWDIEGGSIVNTFSCFHKVNNLAFSTNDEFIITDESEHDYIEELSISTVWNAASGAILGARDQEGMVVSSVTSMNGKSVMSGLFSGKLNIWNVFNENQTIYYHDDRITSADISDDGELILISSEDNRAILWNRNTSGKIANFVHEDAVTYAEFSPGSKMIITASLDHSAVLWDVGTNTKKYRFEHEKAVSKAHFSPSGSSVVTITYDPDSTEGESVAQMWSTETGQALQEFIHQARITHVEFNSTGDFLLTASHDNTAVLWSISTGKAIHRFKHDDSVYHATFSPDGLSVVTSSEDKSAIVWNIYNGKQKYKLKHEERVMVSKFNSDGSIFITGSTNESGANKSTTIAWVADTGEKYLDFKNTVEANNIEISPDGQLLITMGYGVRIWDMKHGHKVYTQSYDSWESFVTFTADSQSILTPKNSNSAVLTNISKISKDIVINAQAQLPYNVRCLTPSERKSYFLSDLSDKEWVDRGCPQYQSNL